MTDPIAPPQSPYLKGNYAPVHSEIAAEDLKVIGEIPQDLAGTFVRNSSNPRFAPKGRYHWFDGDGMLHGVRLRDGIQRIDVERSQCYCQPFVVATREP